VCRAYVRISHSTVRGSVSNSLGTTGIWTRNNVTYVKNKVKDRIIIFISKMSLLFKENYYLRSFLNFVLNRIVRGAVQAGSTRHIDHFWPIVLAPGDCEDGEFGWMKLGRGNRSIRRKPAPSPLCPPQIPLDQTRARTRTTTVGSQRLTAWATARPYSRNLLVV
jgi:hypothetical protein